MSDSRLQRWALGADIVGAVAVVLTLGYVAFEMRSNTNAIQAQTFQSLMSDLNDWRDGLWDAQVIAVMRRWRVDGWEGLTPDEKELRWSISLSRWAIYESAYFANERGILGTEEWTRFEGVICRGYQAEQDIWEAEDVPGSIPGVLTPAFLSYVESTCS